MNLNIYIPDEMQHYAPELHAFFDAMIYKLHHNAHKGKWEDLDLEYACHRLDEENAELREALTQGNTVEVILESADVANFALIIAMRALAGVQVRPATMGDKNND